MQTTTLPTKNELLLTIENQLNVIITRVRNGDTMDSEDYVQMARNASILGQVLIHHTTAARKGKETAAELIKTTIANADGQSIERPPEVTLAALEWLMEYVRDRQTEFTIRHLADAILHVDRVFTRAFSVEGDQNA